MPNITNYSPLIQSMFGGKRTSCGTGSTLQGVFQFSQLNSSSIQSQLKAAGIDTSSKRYKAVIEQMKKTGCKGNMFTNVQAIKNLMKNYNSRGEFVDSDGLTGLIVKDETGDNYKKIIDIPESSKDKMFEATPAARHHIFSVYTTASRGTAEFFYSTYFYIFSQQITKECNVFMTGAPGILRVRFFC